MPKNEISERYLDTLFSQFVRLRDADEAGFVVCCNCQRVLPWAEATCGHYVKKRHRTLRWDELNCHPECAACNMADVNLGYAEYLVSRYGTGIFSLLEKRKNEIKKITPRDRKVMADELKHKIKELKKQKGL